MLRTALAAALLTGAPIAAQAPLGVFAQLTGSWEGTGWMIMGPEGRAESGIRETVTPKAGGMVLTIEGRGARTNPDGSETVVHEAFGIIHLDHDGTTPLLRVFRAGAGWMDVRIELTDRGYTWWLEDPRAGTIRYDMVIDDQGRWVEKGFMTRNGQEMQFFEMTLRKAES
jgi:hypothetical protein